MNKKTKTMFLGIFIVSLLLTATVSAYICINPSEDNEAVKEFKSNMNYLALKHDFDSGLTKEAIGLKLKYFNPCDG